MQDHAVNHLGEVGRAIISSGMLIVCNYYIVVIAVGVAFDVEIIINDDDNGDDDD